MTSSWTFLSYAAALLVFGVLCAGLVNMLRTDSASMSQRLMRWRVGLQFVAICVLMAVLYFRRT
jgi:Hypoxia induced protein conserved region